MAADEKRDQWTPEEALELWKYFGSTGTADKNTMVSVNSLLFTLSAGLLGYAANKLISFHPVDITDPYKGICLAVLGIAISIVSGYVAILYGGYSNWNWAHADAIARRRRAEPQWRELLPRNLEWLQTNNNASLGWTIAKERSKPCEPTENLAPIFDLFTSLAAIAALLYSIILVLSAAKIWKKEFVFAAFSTFVVVVFVAVFKPVFKSDQFRPKVYFLLGLFLGVFEGFAYVCLGGTAFPFITIVSAGVLVSVSVGFVVAMIRRRFSGIIRQ